ncbi:glycosyltransferase [Sphingomonas sp. MMS24-J13]|uniref:glycosyltransferase n=1 Tax=Sphingomonas sp. MMS24-J13 TaxID=3238686 RepID=UPI00384E09A9
MYWSSEALFGDQAASAADHVALVLHQLSTGGTERVAVRLANAWAAAGRRVTLFCGSSDGPLAPLVSPDVEIVPIAHNQPRSRAELGRALAVQMRHHAPDVVVGPGNYHVPILAAMQHALDRQCPPILCKISNPLRRADRSGIRQIAFTAGFRRMTRRFDALIAMSPVFAAEAAFVTGRHDIACIDEPNLDAMPDATRGDVQSHTILCVGRLTRQKNFGLALEAFARMPRQTQLVLLGEGEQDAMLRARAGELGIADRVRFEGYVRNVGDYLDRADVLLCTSLYEGYPAALIEALAAGVPLVTTPCSLALPEILTHELFGTVAAARPFDLAVALQAVMARRTRPAPAPLAELARRHQLARSAGLWLGLIDRTVSSRALAIA